MKIVIAEFMDEAAVEQLGARFDMHYDADLFGRRADLLAALAGADALIVRNRTEVDQALLDAAPRLRVVGRLGVGLDNIAVKACAARAVAVIPATGANAIAVAEYVVGSAMVLLRGACTRSAETAAGAYPRAALSNGREMAGKTLGLIGFGGIGQATARLAIRLGLTVLAHDPAIAFDAPLWNEAGVRPGSFDEVLAGADIVSLHVPLNEQTRKLIGASALARMKPGAIVINTARGGIVDEAALAAALHRSHLGGAAIDVFDEEPLPARSALADAPNTILTPHIAGVTRESNARVSAMIAQAVAAHLLGR